MFKKLLFVTTFFVLLFSGVAFADEIEVILDGETMRFSVEPTIINGNTMVPLRSIFNALGADVKWEKETKKITAKRDGTTVILTIGEKIAYRNSAAIELKEPGVVIDGTTLVPLRFVAQSFGAFVHWNSSSKVISITSDGAQIIYQSNFVRINTADIEELKRIIHIDAVRAEEIVRLRKSNAFTSYNDLRRIKGIGDARVKDMEAQEIIKF